MKKKYTGFIYILPWIVGFLAFTLIPFVGSFAIGLTDYDMVTEANFIGLKNYTNLFQDATFIQSLKSTGIYTVITVPLQVSFALLVAYLLNSNLKGMRFFRTAYYIPSILGGNVAIAVLWRFIFEPNGVINLILQSIGLDPVSWLSTPIGAMAVIILLKVWQFGSSMLLFLAALQDIPESLYESAEIDGATRVGKFIKITLPMISPTIFFNLILQTINAFQEFTGPYLVTGRGPLDSTYLTSMFIYDNAFTYFNMGYASAASWVLFVIILIFTLIMFATQRKWVHYADDGGM